MQGNINYDRRPVDAQNKMFLPYFSTTQDSSSSVVFTQQPEEKFNRFDRLIPVHLDWNRKENMEAHSTIYYDIPALVLRRGQEFSFTLIFNQAFDSDKYHLSLIFKPQTWRNFPVVKIPVNSSFNGWSAKIIPIENQKNNKIGLQIISSSDALIGKYSLLLEILPKNHGEIAIFQFDTDIYFLFNPWEKTDACGLLSSDQIAEYVLNDHGQIYLGSSDLPQSIPWYFGQFENVVLLTALTLLSRVEIPAQQRIDPCVILRILASNICSNPGTTSGIFPSSFDIQPLLCQQNGYTSSPAILKQYLLFNGQSVKGDAGSNWQHAAIFCSLCRSLGIPCRLVTVYNAMTRAQSMAKVNSSITSPYYLWNECWLHRDDLSKDKSGWQVVDSSSIQSNTKVRRLGPCSVAALKAGTLDLKWDTPGIYGLLNGIGNTENMINTKILTKSLKNDRTFEDLTGNYISNEISNGTSSNHDVNIEIKVPGSLKSDEDLTVTLNTNNLSNEQRTLMVAVTLVRINRTGQPESAVEGLNQVSFYDSNTLSGGSPIPIQSLVQNFRLDHNQPKNLQLKVAENHQLWKKCFDSVLRLNIHAVVKETGQIYRKEKYISNGENITMKLFFDDDVVEVGRAAKLNIQINNLPLQSWNNGRITIDGFGVLESLSIRKELPSNNSVTIPVKIVPLRLGIGRLYVTLFTNSLCLSPQSVFLEVTELSEKNTNTNNNNVQLQQSSTEEALHQRIKQSAVENDQTTQQIPDHRVIDATNVDNSIKEKELPTNISNTATTSGPSTKANNTDYAINQQYQNICSPLSDISISEQTSTTIKKDEQQKPVQEKLYDNKIDTSALDNANSINSEQQPEIVSQSNQALKSTTSEIINKQQDTPPISVIPVESETQTTQSPATTEQITEEQDVTSTPAIPVESKDQGVEELTTTQEVNKLEDITPTPVVAPESKTETIEEVTKTEEITREQDTTPTPVNLFRSEKNTTENDRKDERAELQTTVSSETKKEDEEKRAENIPLFDSNIPAATEATNIEEKEQEPLTSASTEITITEDKKDDDQTKLFKTPSLDKTEETVTATTTVENEREIEGTESPRIPSVDHAIETADETTTPAEKKEDDQIILSKIPASENTVGTITETTTIEEQITDNKRELPKISSLDDAIERSTESTTTTTNNEEKEILPPNLSSPDNLASTRNEASVIENVTETSQSDSSEIPLSRPIIDTDTQPVTDENKKQDASSTDKTIETVTQTTTVEESEIPTVRPLNNTTEDVKEDDQSRLSKTPSLDNTIEAVTETVTVEEGKLPEFHSQDTTRQTVTETANTENWKDEKEAQSSQLPSVNTTIETTTESTTVEEKEQQLPETSNFDNTIEIVSPTTVNEDKKEGEEQKLQEINSLDNINKKTEESVTTEDKTEDEQVELLKTTSPKINTETVTEIRNGEDQKLQETPALEITTETETTKVLDNREEEEEEEKRLSNMPSSDNIIQRITESTTTTTTTDNEDKEIPTSNFPSSDNVISTTNQIPVVEHTNEDNQKELPDISVSRTTIETVTQSVTDEGNKVDDQSSLSTVPSSDITREMISETTTEEDNKEDKPNTLLESPSADTTVETVSETKIIPDNEDSASKQSSQIPLLERTNETVSETVFIENTTDADQNTLWRVPSFGNTMEAVPRSTIVKEKNEDEKRKLSEIPSLDTSEDEKEDKTEDEEVELLQTSPVEITTEIVTETKFGEERQENEDQALQKIPSLENPINTVNETTTIEESELPKIPPLDQTTEVVTEITPVQDNREDEEIKLSQMPSSDNIITTLSEVTDNQSELSEIPATKATVDTVTETTTDEDNKQNDQTTQLEIPLVYKITTTITETTTTENANEDDQSRLSSAPSLDSATEIVSGTNVAEERKLPKIPSLDNTSETVTETTSVEPPKSSSVDTTIETITIEDRKEDKEPEPEKIPSLNTTVDRVENNEENTTSELPKVPSLDNVIKIETTTTTVETKTEDEERELPKIPSLDATTTKTISENAAVEDKKSSDEEISLETPSVDTTTETVAETRIDEVEKLQKIPSLENTTETSVETTTSDDQKEVDAVITTTTVEKKKEEEKNLSEIPTLDNSIGTINEIPSIHIPMAENTVLDSSFTTIPQEVDATTQENGTSPSVLQTIQPPVNTEVTKAEEIISPIDATENEQTKSVPTSPVLETKQEVSEKNESITTVTATTPNAEEELDSSIDDLRGWLNDLLHKISDETDKGADAALQVHYTNNDTENRTKVEETALNISQDSLNVNLTDGLDNVSNELPALEETKTNEEPTSLLHGDTDLFVKKTTIITETTTTTQGGDISVPGEDSTRTLKYLVHQSAISDENSNDSISIENRPKIETKKPSPIATKFSTTSITEGSTDQEFGDNIINPTVRDASFETSISDNGEQNSQLLERKHTRIDTLSTDKDSESSSDVDEELLSEILASFTSYAESLTDNILESAIHSYTIEFNENGKYDDNQQSDESNMKTYTSTSLIQSVTKDINTAEPISDNSNQI